MRQATTAQRSCCLYSGMSALSDAIAALIRSHVVLTLLVLLVIAKYRVCIQLVTHCM
jgi:hypothetical protein